MCQPTRMYIQSLSKKEYNSKNWAMMDGTKKDGDEVMENCPLYNEQQRFFVHHVSCEATDEDLKQEGELIEKYCLGYHTKCLRYQTYQDLKIEYLVRKKLNAEFGA